MLSSYLQESGKEVLKAEMFLSRFLFSFLTCLFSVVSSWDLNLLKVSPTYFVSSAAVYKNRAFLTLPRSSCFNNVTNPTLVEVPWLMGYRYSNFRKKMYPNYKDQNWGNCKDLQDAVSVDIEPKRAKLWVLDKGNRKCAAKIVIYNLHYNNVAYSCKLLGLSNEYLSYLVVDPWSNEYELKVYIGGLENEIVVFSMHNLKYWRLKLLRADNFLAPISTDYLVVSMVEPVLYITGSRSSNLYSLNLTQLRNFVGYHSRFLRETPLELNLTFVGHKLGPSAGITADIKGGLNYYLIRDFAVLRWDTSKPLQAEYHDVLAQSYESLPYVPHLFHGPQNGIWALIDPTLPVMCNLKNKTSFTVPKEMPSVKTRIIKLLQYYRKNSKLKNIAF